MMAAPLPNDLDVLEFWWQAGPQRWFARDLAFDQAIADRFTALHDEAAAGNLSDWEDTPSGALALLLVLDQFSRNIYRNDARAFAQDSAALIVAE
ncbi:MAG: DUF924 family protein, partial [Hyphomicrobiales bacterium]|nr:DUF924 family protein [Hyphomicrobiales bacterium]